MEENKNREEERTEIYEKMTAKELFHRCLDKGIECPIKKPREYYMELLKWVKTKEEAKRMKEERLYKLAYEALSNKWAREYDFLKEHPENEISQIRERELWNELTKCEEEMKAKEWAESEYIEKPVISKRDRAIFDNIQVQNGIIMSTIGETIFILLDKRKELNLNRGHIESLDGCIVSISTALRKIEMDTGMSTEEEIKQSDKRTGDVLDMILDLLK